MGKFRASFRCADNMLIINDDRGWGYPYNPTGIPTLFTSMWIHATLYAEDGTPISTIQQDVTASYGTPPNATTPIEIPLTNTQDLYLITVTLMINNIAPNATAKAFYVCRAMNCLAKQYNDVDCECKGNEKEKYTEQLIKLWAIQFNPDCIDNNKAVKIIKDIESICQETAI